MQPINNDQIEQRPVTPPHQIVRGPQQAVILRELVASARGVNISQVALARMPNQDNNNNQEVNQQPPNYNG